MIYFILVGLFICLLVVMPSDKRYLAVIMVILTIMGCTPMGRAAAGVESFVSFKFMAEAAVVVFIVTFLYSRLGTARKRAYYSYIDAVNRETDASVKTEMDKLALVLTIPEDAESFVHPGYKRTSAEAMDWRFAVAWNKAGRHRSSIAYYERNKYPVPDRAKNPPPKPDMSDIFPDEEPEQEKPEQTTKKDTTQNIIK